jgi:Tfp pilus assembly protein PilV
VITFMIVCMGLLVVLAMLAPVLDTVFASDRRTDAVRRLRLQNRRFARSGLR